ncbi:MAG: L,D-transpeptidase [Actinomycetota bacterium]|nr:L,D-transpeptidase [Actinomycetota bacterium]
MTRHVEPPRGRNAASGRHRAEARPRYGRIATLGSSIAVVVIAVLGGSGALPSSADEKPANDPQAFVDSGSGGSDASAGEAAEAGPQSTVDPDADPNPESAAPDPPAGDLEPIDPADTASIDVALPGDSGTGKRVVFSESRQRVWLVTEDEKVRRTYLVSGSVYDNLDPGTFQVYSRDKDAVGIDDSGTMKFFVRFTQGDSGAAIGFHDIPVNAGLPVQTLQQLGTPLSHGCIRQKREDAIALWKFAPLGTTVVVTA